MDFQAHVKRDWHGDCHAVKKPRISSFAWETETEQHANCDWIVDEPTTPVFHHEPYEFPNVDPTPNRAPIVTVNGRSDVRMSPCTKLMFEQPRQSVERSQPLQKAEQPRPYFFVKTLTGKLERIVVESNDRMPTMHVEEVVSRIEETLNLSRSKFRLLFNKTIVGSESTNQLPVGCVLVMVLQFGLCSSNSDQIGILGPSATY